MLKKTIARKKNIKLEKSYTEERNNEKQTKQRKKKVYIENTVEKKKRNENKNITMTLELLNIPPTFRSLTS